MQPVTKYIHLHPKQKFGQILNADQVTSRDVNKDLMMRTQRYSEVRNLGKQYYFKPPNTLVNGPRAKIQIQKY